MHYEVEQKFPVADLREVEARLTGMGAVLSPPQHEVDLYFQHPARDFAVTDEALRIRRKGQANAITYKGPKIDATTKTRREIELPLAPGADAADAWETFLAALGFLPLAAVSKQRRKAKVSWQGRQIDVSLDEVERVGTYVEFELIADEEDLQPAKDCIASLARALGLTGSERRSYLELLLQRQAAGEA